MTITEVHDPQAHLVAPVSAQEDFAAKLRKDAGILLGGLDGIIDLLFNFSPLAEWAIKPFAGDWDAIDRGGQAWSNAGAAILAVADNAHAIPGQIGARWDGGEASSAFRAEVAAIGDKFAQYKDGCDALSQLCATFVEVSKAVAEVIATILGIVAELVAMLIADAAVPVIGWVKGAFDTAAAAPKAARCTKAAAQALEKLYNAVVKFAAEGPKLIKRILSLLVQLLKLVKAGVGLPNQVTTTRTAVQHAF